LIPLSDNHVYIGRGSGKFDLPPSKWENPFVIGRDGSRAEVIKKFERRLRDDAGLMGALTSLKGCTLVCHCGVHEPCHADVITKIFVEEFEPDGVSDGPTSDEDECGQPKARRGSGWLGRGLPVQIGRGARRRDFQDGGGLCSPGNWIPEKRALPPLGLRFLKAIDGIIDAAEVKHGENYWRRFVCALACSKVEADPLLGIERQIKTAFEEILAKEVDFQRDGLPDHVASTIDFELVGAVAAALGDPDASIMGLFRTGVPIGWRCRLPRTPAVFARKERWAKHVGHESGATEWCGNYRSAMDQPEALQTNFVEQMKANFMVRTTYQEAKSKFGGRFRVAAMGAIEQGEGEFRIIHDGTNGVQVNSAIRVRDQEACPAAHDLVAALDHEIAQGTGGLFILALDVSKAHRRVPVDPADWGLQACSELPHGQLPGPHETVWLNTVGTYGVGSASYWWGRLGALLVRILHYIAGPSGLRWALRFADDFVLVSGGTQVWRPLAVAVLLLRGFGVPLKWTKFRGGFRTDWIGYYFDLELREAGVSDSRGRWASSWCRRLAGAKTVSVNEFRQGLGRLAFAAALLVFTKPFLGPLYAWAASAGPGATLEVTPLVCWVLKWIAEQFEQRVRVKFGKNFVHVGERFRADAKAEGDTIVIGGWELAGSEGTAHSRWFSMRLTREEIPWAYVRGDPFRSIAALELLATLVCVLVFEPAEPALTGASISLTASGDNQSNGFTLDKLSSTKFPLYLVLMELSEQLRQRQLLLSVAWRPRDENEEADALTNENFAGFALEKRIPARWSELALIVLPRLADEAVAHFKGLQADRAAARKPGQRAPPEKPIKRAKLRDREPW
jgi:hypothetical protein